MGRKGKNFQAKVRLIRTMKHLLDAANDFAEFELLVISDHPDWKEDFDQIGCGLALIVDSLEGVYQSFWGELPASWETHH